MTKNVTKKGEDFPTLDDLMSWEENPRDIDPEAEAGLTHSLTTFGYLGIVYDRRIKRLRAGNQRVRLLLQKYGKALRMEDGAIVTPDGHRFPVRVVDWDQSFGEAAALAANSPSLAGRFTPGVLPILDRVSVDLPDLVKALRLEDLRLLLAQTSASRILGDPDEIVQVSETVFTKPGDLWLAGKHSGYCGDSTTAADVAKALRGRKPGLMVADPPYGVLYDASWRLRAGLNTATAATGKVANDDRADWTETWKLFPGDVAYVWHGGLHAAEVARSLEAAGFVIRSQIIMAKSSLVISRGAYHWAHEPCWYSVRKGRGADWTGDRKQSTVWNIEHRKSDSGFCAQKPMEAMARPMRNHGADEVYEPFLGSGTSWLAAQSLGKACYALEIMPANCDLSVRRFASLTGQEPVLVRDGKEISWADVKAAGFIAESAHAASPDSAQRLVL